MTTRKPLSKTVRFEVFKRDGFTCQYCGATPPKAILEVDHIVPVAEQGGNEEGNLVTSCFDCNRGKAARLLSVAPESLTERAARVAEAEAQLAAYRVVMEAREERIEENVWRVIEALFDETSTTNARYQSVRRFLQKLPLSEVTEAAGIAHAAKPWSENQRFKYFCGICWNKIRSAEGE